jgi:putative aldouronate transport system substrate-binding protein
MAVSAGVAGFSRYFQKESFMNKTLVVSILILAVSVTLVANGSKEATGSGAELKSVSAVFDRVLLKENGQDEWAEAFKAMTGVELNIVKPAHNQYPEILGATFASGDLPDLVEIQTGDYLTYAASGNLVPLEEYIEASDAVKDIPAELIEAYRLKDGHIYGFPTYNGGGCVSYIRKDWLDNVGLDVPETWDEFMAVLKAFRDDDPDGNGKDDTIGMTLPFAVPAMEFDYYNRFIMQDAMFGFQEKNGRWVDGFTQPEMKAALKRFQDLYAEELIDTEFFSNKTSAARSKIYDSQAGVMEYWSGTWAQRFDSSAKNSNPDAVVIPIPPIREAFYINRVGPLFAITVAADNPAQIFDVFINTMLDKGEGQILFTHGIEGKHFQKGVNGYEMLPEPANPDRPFDKAFSDPTLIMNGWEPLVPLNDLISLSRDIHRNNSIQLSLPEGGNTYVKYVGELMTLKQEVFSKIVVGDVSVDEGLAEYRRKATALKIDEILAELND